MSGGRRNKRVLQRLEITVTALAYVLSLCLLSFFIPTIQTATNENCKGVYAPAIPLIYLLLVYY